MSKLFAVIAGVGPGTGAACAYRFAKAYPVAVLARKPESFEPVVEKIKSDGGHAIGISTDLSSEDSVKKAFEKIKEELGTHCAAAIYNASGPFVRGAFLEQKASDFQRAHDVSFMGAVYFSQAALPLLLNSTKTSEHAPTLIFTGATASVKSNARMSMFSTGKYAKRALSQSLAREFAPQGIHVAHAVIDGVIDIEATKGWLKDQPPEAKIGPEDIANEYWYLHTQSRRCFTNEVDIRPMLEKW